MIKIFSLNLIKGFYYNLIFGSFKILDIKRLYLFYLSYKSFIKKGGIIENIYPILVDYDSESGVASGHYFHLDLIIAQEIFNRKPCKHLDIGSRIDGFVAHVASFRNIYVFDIRNLKNEFYSNINFINIDIQNSELSQYSFDSISSLHALEHFGLGRYGDNIDPNAPYKAFKKICSMLKSRGILYIGVPVSSNPRIEFNAHRIFETVEIINWAKEQNLNLLNFHLVDDFGILQINHDVKLSNIKYGCGIFIFEKNII